MGKKSKKAETLLDKFARSVFVYAHNNSVTICPWVNYADFIFRIHFVSLNTTEILAPQSDYTYFFWSKSLSPPRFLLGLQPPPPQAKYVPPVFSSSDTNPSLTGYWSGPQAYTTWTQALPSFTWSLYTKLLSIYHTVQNEIVQRINWLQMFIQILLYNFKNVFQHPFDIKGVMLVLIPSC